MGGDSRPRQVDMEREQSESTSDHPLSENENQNHSHHRFINAATRQSYSQSSAQLRESVNRRRDEWSHIARRKRIRSLPRQIQRSCRRRRANRLTNRPNAPINRIVGRLANARRIFEHVLMETLRNSEVQTNLTDGGSVPARLANSFLELVNIEVRAARDGLMDSRIAAGNSAIRRQLIIPEYMSHALSSSVPQEGPLPPTPPVERSAFRQAHFLLSLQYGPWSRAQGPWVTREQPPLLEVPSLGYEEQEWPPSENSGNLSEGQDNCSICLERYEIGDKYLQLICDHIFHSNCIGGWLVRKETCPNCRHAL